MLYAEMVDTVLHKAASFDQWGEPTLTLTSRHCCIEYRTRMIPGINGNLVTSMAKLYLWPLIIISSTAACAADTIHYEDILNFDGGDHHIIKIAKAKSLSHTYYLEVWVQ